MNRFFHEAIGSLPVLFKNSVWINCHLCLAIFECSDLTAGEDGLQPDGRDGRPTCRPGGTGVSPVN